MPREIKISYRRLLKTCKEGLNVIIYVDQLKNEDSLFQKILLDYKNFVLFVAEN